MRLDRYEPPSYRPRDICEREYIALAREALVTATDHVTLASATAADLDDALALLTAVDLPHDGVAEHLDGFAVARDAAGRLVGVAGLERHGSVGLLRSVAVDPALHRSGLGSRL